MSEVYTNGVVPCVCIDCATRSAVFHPQQSSFITVPSDTCVPSGQAAEFPCRTVDSSGTFSAGQEWIITTTGGETITFTSSVNSPLPFLPAPYEWITFGSAGATGGLKIVNVNSSFNDITLQCIGIFGTVEPRNNSTSPARLEVAGPPDRFSCSVTCPPIPFVSRLSDMCIVQWTRPQTASCGPVTGYTVAITTLNPSVHVTASTFSHESAALEPFTSYTATVTAVNDLGMSPCSYNFSTSQEEFPVNFTFQLQLLTYEQNVNISISPPVALSPRVAIYSVAVTDVTGQQVGVVQTFPGSSSSLSLDISSLPQCMSYTVSVTASNTGGSATTNDTLSLDPLTSLEVSCVAGVDGCYLEASCVSSQPGLVSGCRLDYMSSAGSASSNITQLSVCSRITAVSCDNQIISNTGTAYDSMLRTLGCPRSGMTKCPLMKDCTVLGITDGTVQYSTEPSASGDFTGGTVATYSCADGYELVGDKNRTCLVDGTWTGVEPQCTVSSAPASSAGLPGWAVATLVVLLLLLFVALAGAAVIVLVLLRRQKGEKKFVTEVVELSENVSYGPVQRPPPTPYDVHWNTSYQTTSAAAPPSEATSSIEKDTGQVVEYEEIGPPPPKNNDF